MAQNRYVLGSLAYGGGCVLIRYIAGMQSELTYEAFEYHKKSKFTNDAPLTDSEKLGGAVVRGSIQSASDLDLSA